MPNIFICGFDEGEADKIKKFVDDSMRELQFQNDAITSILSLRAETCDGKKEAAPYLLVRSTRWGEISLIIEKFKEKGMFYDLEWEVINGFISKEDMKERTPSRVKGVSERDEGKEDFCGVGLS